MTIRNVRLKIIIITNYSTTYGLWVERILFQPDYFKTFWYSKGAIGISFYLTVDKYIFFLIDSLFDDAK